MSAAYMAPRPKVSLARLAQCLAFAAKRDPQKWDYLDWLCKYSDIPAYAEKGMADPLKWLDLYDAFEDAAEILALLADLAVLRGEDRVRASLQAALDRELSQRKDVA